MTDDAARVTGERISTGVPGIDEVLHGGLIANRSYLVRGPPGTGKTILGLHYLTAGVAEGETVLFVNLEEATEDIEQNAAVQGFDLDGVEFLDLSPESDYFADGQSYDIFESNEVDREPVTEDITSRVRALGPDRVFVDPLSQLHYLASDHYQFRKQTLSFMRLLSEQGATVLFTTQDTDAAPDDDLQFMSDGIFELDRGDAGRTFEVTKFRGSDLDGGEHSLRIGDDGLTVYPTLKLDERRRTDVSEVIPSGVPEMDDLLAGGLERGTVSIISGPTGVGKTTTGTQFMKEAAGRGERSVIYLFEESIDTFLERSEAINVPVKEMVDQGTLRVEEIEPQEFSPTEFSHLVRTDVRENDTDIVMIDGVAGYTMSLRGANDSTATRLHTLSRYLKQLGVTVILIDEVPNVTGEFQATEGSISYLGDNLVFLRHLELEGEMRKAIGVLKKRTSDFERTLREFAITAHGIKVGEPLTGLRDILSGSPQWSHVSNDEK